MSRILGGNSGSSFGGRGKGMSRYSKKWHMQEFVTQLHKRMKECVVNWCDEFFKREAPPGIKEHLLLRDKIGKEWLDGCGYAWDHDKIRVIDDKTFAMIFDMKKNGVVVNQFEFTCIHDGSWKEPHKLAMMIYTGRIEE